MNLAAIYAELTAPFDIDLVEIKPGATSHDKSRALALAYVDLRAYQDRLDSIVGPDSWVVEYRQMGNRSIICRLTILGIVREDVGETTGEDDNPATSALAQAFKRACSAFGLGRYLYSLPKLWVDYDQERRQITDPSGAAREMYRRVGLLVEKQSRR